MSVLGRQLNLYANFFGVTPIAGHSRLSSKQHSQSRSIEISQIADLKMILLHFRAELPPAIFDRHEAAKWEIAVSDYYHK